MAEEPKVKQDVNEEWDVTEHMIDVDARWRRPSLNGRSRT